jgi:hypothetical protein
MAEDTTEKMAASVSWPSSSALAASIDTSRSML